MAAWAALADANLVIASHFWCRRRRTAISGRPLIMEGLESQQRVIAGLAARFRYQLLAVVLVLGPKSRTCVKRLLFVRGKFRGAWLWH